ncbi:MAG: hypothetical protein AAB036_11835 [Elusimicrobiota bacterium]
MKTPLFRRLNAALVLAAAFGCSPPKYAQYESVRQDFSASVPWGWQVMTDQQGDAFTQVNFIGPFDPDFYLGAPSLSVRWYKRYSPHRLRDGRLEMYGGVDDFINQNLKEVYGPTYFFVDPNDKPADGPSEVALKNSGLKAKYFTVLSATPAPESMHWGVTLQSGTGKPHILRKHAYALVPVEGGFYVLCYPATQKGYDRYLDRFLGLMGSFSPRTAGPGGAKIRPGTS